MIEAEAGQLDSGRLREAALHGVRWVAAGRVASEIVALASSIVLARLLAPAEFGEAAVALVLLAFSAALMGSSFGTPLVQRKEIEPAHVRTSVLLSLVTGVVTSAVVFAAAPLTRPLFGDEVSDLLQLMSPVFAVSSVGLVPHALLQRSLNFRRISSVEVASILVRAAASVALAVAGLGAEALVLGALAGSAAFAFLLLLAAPGTWPGWDRRCAREIVRFGLPTALTGLVSQTNRNLDYAILGAMMSPTQVGHYWRAYQLGVEYERKLTTIMTRMALPVLARSKSMADMRRIRLHMMRTNAIAIFGVLAAFVAVAPQLVPWVFGSAWEPSVLPAQILAVTGMAAAVNAGAGPLLLAAGHPRALLGLSSAFFFVFGATVLLAAPHGIVAVCIAGTAAQIVRTVAMHWLLLDRLAGIPFGDLRREVAPAAAASAALLAVAVPLAGLLDGAGAGAPVVVVCATAIGAAVYAAVVRLLFPAAWRDVAEIARRVLGVRRRGPVRGLRPAAGASRP